MTHLEYHKAIARMSLGAFAIHTYAYPAPGPLALLRGYREAVRSMARTLVATT